MTISTKMPENTFNTVYEKSSKRAIIVYGIIHRLQSRLTALMTERYTELSGTNLYAPVLSFANGFLPDSVEMLDNDGVSERVVTKIVGNFNRWVAIMTPIIDAVPVLAFPDKSEILKEVKLHVRMLICTFDPEYINE